MSGIFDSFYYQHKYKIDINRIWKDLNNDISGWDTSNVTGMSHLFQNSTFSGDISKWNVSNVTNMSSMFSYSKFNQDISGWNVSNVTNMNSMFSYSKFNQDISYLMLLI